jgi:hypothetical protein
LRALPTSCRRRPPALLVALLLLASPAVAADLAPDAAPPSSLLERMSVRVRYGVALRAGAQQDVGPGLVYGGLTPNDLAVAGGWFPHDHLGLGLSVQRESFALLEGGTQVTGGALLRLGAGPVGRVVFGPVKLEAQGGYTFAHLPAFGSSVAPAFSPVARHGLLLGAKGTVKLPRSLLGEVRGELPVAFRVRDGAGGPASASGFSAGAALSAPIVQTELTDLRLALDYQFVQDQARTRAGVDSTQRISRVGAFFQVDLLKPGVVRPPRVGGVRVEVVDDATSQPLSQAAVVLVDDDGGSHPLPLAEDGSAERDGLPPGKLRATVALAGYLPAEGATKVVAGDVQRLVVRVRREPPRVGALSITVVDKNKGQPIAGAQVAIGEGEWTADEAGVVKVENLEPGLVSVSIRAEGFTPGDEVAQIVVGRTSELPVVLVPEKQRVPATISGIVRSTRGGGFVRARLEIPELRLKVQASEQGDFSLTVPSGAYRVIISAPGYRQQMKQVTVREGDQTIFNVDLHPSAR